MKTYYVKAQHCVDAGKVVSEPDNPDSDDLGDNLSDDLVALTLPGAASWMRGLNGHIANSNDYYTYRAALNVFEEAGVGGGIIWNMTWGQPRNYDEDVAVALADESDEIWKSWNNPTYIGETILGVHEAVQALGLWWPRAHSSGGDGYFPPTLTLGEAEAQFQKAAENLAAVQKKL